jgi:ribokinase
MLDPPARALPNSLLRRVGWITPNETETAELLKKGSTDGPGSFAAADELLASGVQNVLLKLGSQGCLVAEATRPKEYVPAFPVAAADSTAAGDAFNAGLCHRTAAVRSAVFASAVAAISVTRTGAQAPIPSILEIEDFLTKKHTVQVF